MVGLILEDFKPLYVNDRILAENSKIASSFLAKNIGFMFNFKMNFSLIFPFKQDVRFPITNLFVFFPIDLVFLDGQKTVILVKKHFKPFSVVFKPEMPYRYLVELPSSMNCIVEKGDKFKF